MNVGVLVRNMKMPDGCPFCPLSHWTNQMEFMGCDIVPGKRYAVHDDPEYANSPARSRPDWCPLVEMTDRSPMISPIQTPEDRRQPMEIREANP